MTDAKKRQERQQMGHGRKQQVMEQPRKNCANGVASLSVLLGTCLFDTIPGGFFWGPAHSGEKDQRVTPD